MGVTQSTESVLTAVVLAGALGFGYHYYTTSTEDASASVSTDANSVKKSKKKKKKGLEVGKSVVPTTLSSTSSQLVHSSGNNTIPGQFDQQQQQQQQPQFIAPTSNPKIKKPKKKTSTAKRLPGTNNNNNEIPSSSSSSQQPPPTPSLKSDTVKIHSDNTAAAVQNPSQLHSNTTEGSRSWTRVVSRRKQGVDEQSSIDVTTSDAGLTSSVTGNSSSSPIEKEVEEDDDDEEKGKEGSTLDQLQTLAEKLVPKNPKTHVDDMLPDYNQPTLSRVMRVQPLPDEKPAPGFSWMDYEDVDADGEDDGWGVVKSKRSRPGAAASTSTSATTAKPSSQPAQTQKQRQNAKKREAQKAAKAAAESDRVAALAKHKRELEKARIIEQSRSGGKTGKVSGGMAPVVDAAGKLVWE